MRRRRHGQEQLWQIVYLDFMTTVMIFFFALWAVSKAESNGLQAAKLDSKMSAITLKEPEKGEGFFVSGSTALTEAGKAKLDEWNDEVLKALIIKDSENSETHYPILVVEGHTDDDGAKERNFSIYGFQRAFSVAKYLDERIKKLGLNDFLDHVAICSYADNLPVENVKTLDKNDTKYKENTDKARRRNRRVVIRAGEIPKE